MAGKTRDDYESVTRVLLRCIEKTRSPPSLRRLSLDAVATTMWKITDLDLARNYCKYGLSGVTDMIEEKQKKMLDETKTLIPESLLTDLNYSLALKVTQILSANDIYKCYGKTEKREYFWTPLGRVNEQEIIRFLIKNDVMSCARGNLRVAFNYCLEDEVKRLWEPYGRELIDYCVAQKFEIPWQYEYWISFVAGQNISSANIEEMIHFCIHRGCSTAVEYFWSKLDPDRRDRVFRLWIDQFGDRNLSSEGRRDVCFSLMSRMTESQLLSLLESKLFFVLKCLMISTRPEAKLFMSTAIRQMCGFISEQERTAIVQQLMELYLVTPVLFEKPLMMLCNGGSVEWKSKIKMQYPCLLTTFNERRSAVCKM